MQSFHEYVAASCNYVFTTAVGGGIEDSYPILRPQPDTDVDQIYMDALSKWVNALFSQLSFTTLEYEYGSDASWLWLTVVCFFYQG